MQLLADLVSGRSVALVGNAMSIAARPVADEIDAHDIVIRMNLGLPGIVPSSVIGKRTDVWAAAKHWPKRCPSDAKLIVFMKLTAMGNMHWHEMISQPLPCPAIRWPSALEQKCRDFVGADPGTGIRLLWWLKKHGVPRSVSVYGFDCWKTPSHWSGRGNTPNHRPDLEAAAMRKLLA